MFSFVTLLQQHLCMPGLRHKISDWIGIGSSWLCLIHCVAAPVLLSMVGLGMWLHSEWLEAAILLLAVLAVSFTSSRTQDREVRVLLWAGLVVFCLGFFLDHSNDYLLHLPASVLLLTGHLKNLRQQQAKPCAEVCCNN